MQRSSRAQSHAAAIVYGSVQIDCSATVGLPTYLTELLTGLKNNSAASTLPVPVLTNTDISGKLNATGVSYVQKFSLAGVDLNDYSTVYVVAGGTCCSDNPSLVSRHETAFEPLSGTRRTTCIPQDALTTHSS